MTDPSEKPQGTRSERPALSQRSIVILRVLLLLAATGAVFAGISVAFSERGGHRVGARYVCPMHPEVKSEGPSSCPICGMALEAVGGADGRSMSAAGMSDITAVENVRKHKIFDFARVHSLLPNLREIRGPAWAESEKDISVLFYKDQIAALAEEEPGTFTLTASPKTSLAVTRAPGSVVDWDRSTALIRFRIDSGEAAKTGHAIRPGEVGWLRVADKARAVLGVPVSSVLQAPEGPYVLAWRGGVKFEKQPIEIGETFSRQGFAVVLSGLRANELVVARATFFLDADRRQGLDSQAAWSNP